VAATPTACAPAGGHAFAATDGGGGGGAAGTVKYTPVGALSPRDVAHVASGHGDGGGGGGGGGGGDDVGGGDVGGPGAAANDTVDLAGEAASWDTDADLESSMERVSFT